MVPTTRQALRRQCHLIAIVRVLAEWGYLRDRTSVKRAVVAGQSDILHYTA